MSKYYKEKSKVDFQVGIFVIIILILLFAGYGWFKNSFSLKDKQYIKVLFPNAESIMKGDLVTCFGVTQGRVKDVAINKDGALMTLELDKEVILNEGTEFTIKETDLMGNKQIDITPSQNEVKLNLDKIYQGTIQSGITSAIAKANKTLDSINLLLKELQKEDGILSNTNELISNTNFIAKRINNDYPEIANSIIESISNINQLSNKFEHFFQANEKNISSSITELEETLRASKISIHKLNSVLSKVDLLSEDFMSEDSSLRLLLSDKELYNQMKNTVNSADSLLKDIKKHPKKYLELKVF